MSKELDIIFSISKNVMGNEFHTKNRKHVNVFKRSVFYKVCRSCTMETLDDIGFYVKRDHATVRHGLMVFDQEIAVKDIYKIYLDAYNEIILKVKAKTPIHLIQNMNKKEVMQHIIINQRQRIVQLENVLDKIPHTIKTKYV
nr:hypothetical protein [uncultured Allomuricauda sp.]